MISVVAVLFIHKKRPVSPWLLMGLVPTLVGAYLAFRR